MKLLIAEVISASRAVSLCTALSVCERISTSPGLSCRNGNPLGTSSACSSPILVLADSQVAPRTQCRQRLPVLLATAGGTNDDDDSVNSMPEGEKDKSALSSYGQTGDPVKTFVSGLTDFFVRISDRPGEDTGRSSLGAAADKPPLSVEELEAGIREEYAKNYLWTGAINEALYEEDCSFTDPTLSFSGLSTYKRNVASLQGVLNVLLVESASVLYSCQLLQEESCVQTRWRMLGDLRLPWGPTIDVIGRTTFSYDADRGNRIYSYDEVWEVEAGEALLQLFRPGRRNKSTPLVPTPPEEED